MTGPDDLADAGACQVTITGFHQDAEGHWVADLSCGHTQHMRHQPPWQRRPWVLTAEGRGRFVGVTIPCPRCADRGKGSGDGGTV